MSESFPSRASRHHKSEKSSGEETEKVTEQEVDLSVTSEESEPKPVNRISTKVSTFSLDSQTASLDSQTAGEKSVDSAAIADASSKPQSAPSRVQASKNTSTSKGRGRLWLIIGAVVVVIALGVAGFFLFSNNGDGIPSSVPVPAGAEKIALSDTGRIVTFSVEVDSAEAQAKVLADFQESWESVGENLSDEANKIYSFEKDGTNATIGLLTYADAEGADKFTVSYALSGNNVGSGKDADDSGAGN